jgi:hypothetical protein
LSNYLSLRAFRPPLGVDADLGAMRATPTVGIRISLLLEREHAVADRAGRRSQTGCHSRPTHHCATTVVEHNGKGDEPCPDGDARYLGDS